MLNYTFTRHMNFCPTKNREKPLKGKTQELRSIYYIRRIQKHTKRQFTVQILSTYLSSFCCSIFTDSLLRMIEISTFQSLAALKETSLSSIDEPFTAFKCLKFNLSNLAVRNSPPLDIFLTTNFYSPQR